ncbi:MAG: PilZ domain-containing protein [Desulfobacula sp.]|nr:PilZ domain-containing protein [Desulfobacula sp.]MDA8134928.1 PilZ domain-containing protein [Desulfobacteraceae bacterium]
MKTDRILQDEIIKRVGNLSREQQEEILGILKSWQTGRQREYQRLQTKADIDVVVGDRVIRTRTADISAGGLFIQASGKFEPQKSVRVVFTLPGSPKPFKLQGSISRVEETGIAIQFENITPYFKEILDDVIWENKDPEKANF